MLSPEKIITRASSTPPRERRNHLAPIGAVRESAGACDCIQDGKERPDVYTRVTHDAL
jgi:hypothetical protein